MASRDIFQARLVGLEPRPFIFAFLYPPCRGFVHRSLHEWSKIFWWWNNLRKRSQRLGWVGARKKLNEWNERSSVMMTECQAFKVFQKSSSSSFSPTLKFFERMQKSKKLLFDWKPTRTELEILNLKSFGVLTFDDLCENWQVFLGLSSPTDKRDLQLVPGPT